MISLTTQVATGQPLVAVLCFALAGALLGFLRWNFHPATIFAGTSGVQFVGYTLAVLSILGTAKVAVALLVLGVPIIDTFWIIVRRLSQRPLAVHARTAATSTTGCWTSGLSHRQTVLVIYGICLALAVLSLRPVGRRPSCTRSSACSWRSGSCCSSRRAATSIGPTSWRPRRTSRRASQRSGASRPDVRWALSATGASIPTNRVAPRRPGDLELRSTWNSSSSSPSPLSWPASLDWCSAYGVGWRAAPRALIGPAPSIGVRGALERSIGMYLVRRLTRRPTAGEPDTIVPPTALTADEVAYRIGVAGAPVPPPGSEPFVPPPATGAGAAAAAASLATAGRADLLIGDPAAMTPVVSTLGPRSGAARCARRRGKPAGAPRPRRSGRAHRPRRDRSRRAQLLPAGESSRATDLHPVRGGGGGEPDARSDPETHGHDGPRCRDCLADGLADAAGHGHARADLEADTQADQGRPALDSEADRSPDAPPDRGADASPDAEADTQADPETDTQADAGARRRAHLRGLVHAPGGSIAFNGAGSTGETAYSLELR